MLRCNGFGAHPAIVRVLRQGWAGLPHLGGDGCGRPAFLSDVRRVYNAGCLDVEPPTHAGRRPGAAFTFRSESQAGPVLLITVATRRTNAGNMFGSGAK